ncbi:polysaccharide biosynthesis C-terminal domain-containing protein, partial [Microvirga sp. 3-52]|nr:polysaccharide biosynthesis C-terminal domain-containing protein [Microvirga sp. 3-52]
RLEIIKKAVLTVLIALSLWLGFGIMGLIGAAVANSYISLFINTYFSAREIAYSAIEQMKDLLPVFVYSIIMGVAVFLLGEALPFSNFIILSCQIVFGIAIYTIICKLAKVEEFEAISQ